MDLPGCENDPEATRKCFLLIALAIAAPQVPGAEADFQSVQKLETEYQTKIAEMRGTKEELDRLKAGIEADQTQVAMIETSTPETILAVARTYNTIKGLPFLTYFFPLVSGVVVALFTGVMGAIGAGVYSLLETQRLPKDKEKFSWYAFGVRPLLGATAGFMVFFVVSAGAVFFLQAPPGGSATEAVNSLSPAALASLGAFAGLSSDKALKWLTSKAESFFEIPETPVAVAKPSPKKASEQNEATITSG